MAEQSVEPPRVESFLLRFVEDSPGAGSDSSTRAWHAVILHVQTREEKSFVHFADAVAFIARYVPVGEFVFPGQALPEMDAEPKAGGRA